MKKVTLISGDGIGPSVTESAVKIIEAAGVNIDWEVAEAGELALRKFKETLPTKIIESIRKNRVALKGPLNTPTGSGFKSVNVELRKKFGLYLNLRPIRSFDGVKSRYENVDLVICRENVEDIYAGQESGNNDKGIITGFITRANSERFFKRVFEYAKKNGRKKVTIVHKANIIKCAYGLFLKVGYEVAGRYPEIKVEDRIVDNMTMQLVIDPLRFDIIAASNMFGDILSDLCAGFVGGLGLAPGANIGDDTAIFEAVHGTAPDIAGKNLANPTSVILSAVMMLEYMGEAKAARMIRVAVKNVLAEGKDVTRDINPAGVGTIEMTNAIIDRINDLHDLTAECCA